jgi:pentatricopeptide repeat protein
MSCENLRAQCAHEAEKAENFDFCCPGSERNIENVRRIFQRHFSNVGFNGVFLDKIRYPSPANPPWGWQVCFCRYCLAQYRRQGLSPKEIRLAAKRLPEAKAPFTALAYQNGAYRFADAAWERFFRAKSEVVTASVKSLSGWFRTGGYRVGLDVFAPFLSPFVGQDIEALSRCCDWLKPMMYRKVYAPAGLPFEVDALCRAGCPDKGESWFSKMTDDGHRLPNRHARSYAQHRCCDRYLGG